MSQTPDISLEFFSNAPHGDLVYPSICQIAFSESLEDVIDTIESVVEGDLAIQMVILLDVKEAPDFSSPLPESDAWKSLSKDSSPLSLTEFVMASNLAIPFTEPVTVANHVWCSIPSVDFYVWLRDPSTGVLDVRATTSEHTAYGVSTPDIVICT